MTRFRAGCLCTATPSFRRHLADGEGYISVRSLASDAGSITAHAATIESTVAGLTDFDGELSDRQIREIGKVVSELINDLRGRSAR
jgi:hypothetical protein